MLVIESFCYLIGVNPTQLHRQEYFLVEAELFDSVCEELKENFKQQLREYFVLIKLTKEQEYAMLEEKFLQFVINDILMSGEYSVAGISNYTQIHEDVIRDVILEKNKSPSMQVSRKIIHLHRAVRPELYRELMKKIVEKYQAMIEEQGG